jgi:tetratricopeptide (TPR) repeat protein
MAIMTTHNDEVISEKLKKGFSVLERKEPYDAQTYSGHVEAAAKEFRDVLQIDQNCYGALVGLGRCYSYNPQQYADAIFEFRRALEVCSNEGEPYYQMGVVFFHAGERGMSLSAVNPYQEALQCFQKAIALGYEKRAWLYNQVGMIHFRMENYEEAVAWFERSAESLKEEGGWIPSTFNLAADASEYLGNFAQAIRWYERLIEHGFRDREKEIRQKIKNLRALDRNKRKVL